MATGRRKEGVCLHALFRIYSSSLMALPFDIILKGLWHVVFSRKSSKIFIISMTKTFHNLTHCVPFWLIL
jgi:hypothetical protein